MKRLATFALFLLAVLAACKDVPIDDERNDRRLVRPRGVIRGTVTYVGPRPCSANGHILGNAIVLVFDRRNPPPPAGLATTAVNFVAVPGDILFANEPRSVGRDASCPPASDIISASAPFAVAPVEGGSYIVAAFYDRRGRFWPTFKYRNLPEAGDLAGGYVDLADAQKNAGNPSYQPKYIPVDVGIPGEPEFPGAIPDFTIGKNGYVADNIPVTIGSVVPFTRPYFHPEGAETLPPPTSSEANQTGDPLAVPVVAMTQDVRILAAPKNLTPQTIAAYQGSFRSLKLVWGVAKGEEDKAVDRDGPFGLQLPPLPPQGNGGLLVFSRGGTIPENPLVADLWPQVALVKLADDPFRKVDPQALVVQGTPEEENVTGKRPGPLVVLQGITLLDDSLVRSTPASVPTTPTTAALRDHVTVLLRPAVLCFDPKRVDHGALLVTPHFTSKSADASEPGEKPLFDPNALKGKNGIRDVREACLPKGRFAITTIYPTGQAWTVPNETGGCAKSEGAVVGPSTPTECAGKRRPVLLSQGARGVLEIVAPTTDEGKALCASKPVPEECVSP
jgi:hypothetical protein